MRFADVISVSLEEPVESSGGIGGARNRVIRFYDPTIGRFTTPDPLTGGPDDPTISYRDNIYEFVDAVIKEYFASIDPHRYKNRYVYCLNNPVNMIDPLGLQEKDDNELQAMPTPIPAPRPEPPKEVGGQPTPGPQSAPTPALGSSSSTSNAPTAVTTPSPYGPTKPAETASSHPPPTQLEHPTQVAQAGTPVPGQGEGSKVAAEGGHSAGVDIARGAVEGIAIGSVDKVLEKGVAGSRFKAFGRGAGLAVAIETAHGAYNIVRTIRDPDPRLSGLEKASLVSLQVSASATTLAAAGLGAGAGTFIGGPPGAVILGGVAGGVVANRASWVVNEQKEIYRWN